MSQASTPLTPTRLYHDPVERLECDPSAYNLAETTWHAVKSIGHHAGYDKAELAHNLKVIRLKGRTQLWRDIAFVGWAFFGAALSLLVNGIIK